MNFEHGGNWAAYEEICGGEVLDFSANVSPFGLQENVREAVIASLKNAHRYPDPESRELRKAIAQKYELCSGQILCGNGAADLIYRIVCAVKPRRALVPAPDFGEYENALRAAGCEISYWEWMRNDRPAQTGSADMIILSNPNNPSGCLHSAVFLRELADRCEAENILLVVDECFMDFIDCPSYHSLLNFIADHKNLLVLRAFTKFYGMAGLRLGWCATSNSELISRMKTAGPPWSVSIPAQAAGIAALSEDGYSDKVRRLITAEREHLISELRTIGFRVVSGEANYILFYTDETDLAQILIRKGIAVRDCSNYRGLGPGWFRVSVRLAAENGKLLHALRNISV